ncbi:U3 SMALL NUCLEOLAR RIBONUCLEOprotein MPP10 [Salix viminalis]|uniref:U3 small nucleolar ribonucleoprotein protein MPP10 n=1 Tax=Salix viminalis TaxID=40686 RepID=A0A9Q0NVH4_SALVM|nr:U3 SMALL NUCLEOLAR RIBONUCLEOprotein MPP10 [Salix viminalis]
MEGMEALNRLKSTDPPLWLAPSPSLSQTARTACKHLFSSVNPHVPKSPFDQLLIDGCDAEQIWQQIDLQSQPLLSSLRRQVLHFQKNPEEIKVIGDRVLQGKKKGVEDKEVEKNSGFDNGDDEDMYEIDDEDDSDDDAEEESGEEEEGGEEEESGEEEGEKGVIEDKFLKIRELEDFLEEEDAKEYGLDTKKNNKKKNISEEEDEEDEDDDDDEGEDEEDEEDEDDELGVFGNGDDEDEDASKRARYEDFFGGKKRTILKKKTKEDSSSDDELDDEALNERKGRLSTHEKQLQKLQSEIEQMEKANLEPKTWTMQGEVTAASRPKNSALEVDLDFEHNMRPAPVITEEVTATLEDMIKNRIIEGRFDDIHKAPSLTSKAPRERKELDENKSKKGLADVYEEEYVQKTNPAAAPLSFSNEQKKEASVLFKKLCLKLDALSHFHFAPKPVIEDMSIQANVPALAMEEIAPMAVSDAAMLAPEEVFSGKGDIKEEAELTQAERKRRRANKKRKFKAESVKRMGNKQQENTTENHDDGKEES